jgi:hypothetical protein
VWPAVDVSRLLSEVLWFKTAKQASSDIPFDDGISSTRYSDSVALASLRLQRLQLMGPDSTAGCVHSA